jgi:large subunit ribosomal protein L21
MYGVVEIKGHQYRVKEGDLIDVQKIDAEIGTTLEFNEVLFIGGDSPKVGAPTVAGAKVTAEVVRQARSRKVIVFKRKPGAYRKKNGHRQHYTALRIKEIKA